MEKDARRREDPYEVLGVHAGASGQDIVRAYRRAVLNSHPDTRPADPQAAVRFRALTDAYSLLSDAGRRAAYDRSRGQRRAAYPEAPPSRSGDGPAPAGPFGRPAPPLRAGPVHIQPPPRRSGSEPGYQHDGPGDPYDVLARYLRWLWGRP